MLNPVFDYLFQGKCREAVSGEGSSWDPARRRAPWSRGCSVKYGEYKDDVRDGIDPDGIELGTPMPDGDVGIAVEPIERGPFRGYGSRRDRFTEEVEFLWFSAARRIPITRCLSVWIDPDGIDAGRGVRRWCRLGMR